MDGIKLMVDEHKWIKRMLEVIRSFNQRVLRHEKVDFEDLFLMIDFVRNYADKHHHLKEEDLLFKYIMEELGSTGEKLIRNGMMVEHDLGRLYMKELEESVKKILNGDENALVDVVGHSMSYYHLLQRHIAKEDKMVYPFGEKNLSREVLEIIHAESENMEKEAEKKGVQRKYESMVRDLENKYLISQ